MKKIVSIALAGACVLSLAACGGTETTSSKVTSDGQPIKPMRYVTPGDPLTDQANVLKAVNEKLIADGVNVEVEFIRIPWASYQDKLNAMLTSGEEFELLHIMQDIKNMSSLANQDAIVPIDDALAKYPDLKSKFTETQWQGTKFNGKTYAVPDVWENFAPTVGYLMSRTNALKAVSPTPPKTSDELYNAMVKMQKNIITETELTPYHWAHQLNIDAQYLHREYASFPFSVEPSLGLTMDNGDGTISSWYESEEFKKDANYFRKLYTSGLIHPDVLSMDAQFKYDQEKFGAFLPSPTFSYGDEPFIKENLPEESMTRFYLAPEKPHIVQQLIQNMNAISSTSEDPESGVKFLNWLYSSKENHDLLVYGVEGVDYTATAPDRFTQIKDENNKPLYAFDSWMIGYEDYMRYNEDISDTAMAGIKEEIPADKILVMPSAGFIFDATNVASQQTALSLEVKNSIYPIKYGLVEYDANIDAAISKLKAAGLDAYMAEYNKQFTAYMTANNIKPIK